MNFKLSEVEKIQQIEINNFFVYCVNNLTNIN